jgi:hypothetical protein
MRYSKEHRTNYYEAVLQMEKSIYGDGITESRRYQLSELRYRLRKLCSISEDLKKAGYNFIIVQEEVEYIYNFSACGLNYIGKTKDPFQRFGRHITDPTISSALVAESAIDNSIVPLLEVIDICAVGEVAVEAYWINNFNCVNTQKYKLKKYELQKSPYSHKCVIARQKLGIEPFEFSSLINLEI